MHSEMDYFTYMHEQETQFCEWNALRVENTNGLPSNIYAILLLNFGDLLFGIFLSLEINKTFFLNTFFVSFQLMFLYLIITGFGISLVAYIQLLVEFKKATLK